MILGMPLAVRMLSELQISNTFRCGGKNHEHCKLIENVI